MAWQHSVDPAMPGVRDVVAALPATPWLSAEEREDARVPGRDGVRHTADQTVLTHLLTVLDTSGLHAPVRATLRAACGDSPTPSDRWRPGNSRSWQPS
ncbi:hypothetical protein [Streptomyces sp. Ag109_G2-15]|uniref:hypothetical protein n=1 Tax=Streptomyces sp. Ag109_G2-15 TaxID=1938850 RepID=UPI000BD957E2|nr:hypothetical protein [Streptomyces sp. Ag109_G2-15]SOD90849.1 hypothetical protein SAMN06272765_6624 [Streptomyces sp. Ag109_G2-15]